MLAAAAIADPTDVADRSLGELVTDHRSSWVRRLETNIGSYYIKTYDYPTPYDRWRGVLRTTLLARSRAAREWDGLVWLRRAGFEAPTPLGVFEHRRRGLLWRATLVTEAWPGQPLDRLLPELPAADRDALLVSVENLIHRLHRAGWRDRNLDLRNLLAHRSDQGWRVAKIDSPRHRLRPAGAGVDRAAQRDWRRLAASLQAAGLLPPGR